MNFLDNIENDTVIICDTLEKMKLLTYISSLKTICNVHFYTWDILKKKIYFDYSKETIYEVSKYLNTDVETTEEMIYNLYYIENKKYNNSKLDNLVKLKNYLDENNLLIYDPYFLDYINSKDILVVISSFLKYHI